MTRDREEIVEGQERDDLMMGGPIYICVQARSAGERSVKGMSINDDDDGDGDCDS
jgi:hypothetical protein